MTRILANSTLEQKRAKCKHESVILENWLDFDTIYLLYGIYAFKLHYFSKPTMEVIDWISTLSRTANKNYALLN